MRANSMQANVYAPEHPDRQISRDSITSDFSTWDVSSNVHLDPFTSLFSDQGDSALRKSIRKEIRRRSNFGGRIEAEQEVLIQELVKLKGSQEAALLHVVMHMCGEQKVLSYATSLLHKGARPFACDGLQRTPLHHAVRRRMISVTQKLLEHNAPPNVRDLNGISPFSLALQQRDDELASLLLDHMDNRRARTLFVSGEALAEFNFHTLLSAGDEMQKTVLSVLDCLFEESALEKPPFQSIELHHNLLESDSNGFPPNHPSFSEKSKSALHLIAHLGNKSIVYHDAVRLLIRRKWSSFAKTRFQLSALVYMVKLLLLTYSAVLACSTDDPFTYSGPLHISRLATESCAYLMVSLDFLLELLQICQLKTDYFTDPFNYIDMASVLCLLTVLPLRLLMLDPVHWYLFSIGYLLMTMRVFKYAAVFRDAGVHTQILWKIISQDIVHFVFVFAIFLLAFSGAIMLSLRANNPPTISVPEANITISPKISFFSILFMGIRTLVEAQPVVEYTGSDTEYNWLSSVLMVLYLMTCIVVLLNILIAQLSDTYHDIKIEAEKALELSRAAIVTRVEMNNLFAGKAFRRSHYIEREEVSFVLEKWQTKGAQMHERDFVQMRNATTSIEMRLHAINSKLARQELSMLEIRKNTDLLLDAVKIGGRGKQTLSQRKNARRSSL